MVSTSDPKHNTSEVQTEPGKRRWFRFRLRTLLVLTAFLCAWLGWLMHGIHQQRRAVAVLERSGAQVGYLAFSSFPPWTSVLSRYRRVRIDLSMPDDLKRVTAVTINDPQLREEDLEVLPDLPQLRYLDLCGTHVTDASLRYVKQCKCRN